MLENLGRFCRDCLHSFVGRLVANGTKKRGFTLAEILIAIAIIGILAVLVLPAVTTRAQNRGFEISYNAQVKSLLNALESLPIVENRSSLTDTMMYTNNPNLSDYSDTSGAFIKKYMKVSKYCGNTPSGCFADQYNEIKNHDRLTYSTNSIKGACAILKNGVSICIKPQTKPTANEKTYVTGYLDLNGPKGPNVYGRDLRSFMVDVGEAKVYNAENPESVVTLLDIDPNGPSTCEGGICDPCVVDPDSCNNECTKPDAPANFECCKAKYHPNISGPSDACCAYRVDEKCNKCQDSSYKADHPDECGGSCTGHTITGPNDACCTAEMKAIEPKCCSDSDNSDFCCSANSFTFGCCQKSAANGDIRDSGHKCCQVFKNNGGEDGAFYKKYCTDACTEDRNSEFCCKTPQRQEQMSNPAKSGGTVILDGCCSTNSGKDNKKCCNSTNWHYGSDVKSNSVAKACCNLGGTYIQKQPSCCSDDSVFTSNKSDCCKYSNDRKNSSGCCQYRTGTPAAPSGNTYDACCKDDGSYTIGNQSGQSVNCVKPTCTSAYCCTNAFDKLNDNAKQACCSANSNYPGCACKSEGVNFKGQNDVACCNPNSVKTDYCCEALKIMNKSDEEVCTNSFIYCSKFKNSIKNGECTCVNNKQDVSNKDCCKINKNNVDKETWKSSCCSIADFDPYRGGTATECCDLDKTLTNNPNKLCCDYLYSSASGTVKKDIKDKCCNLEGWNVSECTQTPDPVPDDPDPEPDPNPNSACTVQSTLSNPTLECCNSVYAGASSSEKQSLKASNKCCQFNNWNYKGECTSVGQCSIAVLRGECDKYMNWDIVYDDDGYASAGRGTISAEFDFDGVAPKDWISSLYVIYNYERWVDDCHIEGSMAWGYHSYCGSPWTEPITQQRFDIPTDRSTAYVSANAYNVYGGCGCVRQDLDDTLQCKVYLNGNLISEECNDDYDGCQNSVIRIADNFTDTRVNDCCVDLADNPESNPYCCTINSSDEGCCSYMRAQKGDAWIKQNAPQCNPNPCTSGNMAQCCQDEKNDINYFDSEDQWAQTCCLQKDASGNNYAIGNDSRCCSYYWDNNSQNYYYTPKKDKGYGQNDTAAENICGGDPCVNYNKSTADKEACCQATRNDPTISQTLISIGSAAEDYSSDEDNAWFGWGHVCCYNGSPVLGQCCSNYFSGLIGELNNGFGVNYASQEIEGMCCTGAMVCSNIEQCVPCNQCTTDDMHSHEIQVMSGYGFHTGEHGKSWHYVTVCVNGDVSNSPYDVRVDFKYLLGQPGVGWECAHNQGQSKSITVPGGAGAHQNCVTLDPINIAGYQYLYYGQAPDEITFTGIAYTDIKAYVNGTEVNTNGEYNLVYGGNHYYYVNLADMYNYDYFDDTIEGDSGDMPVYDWPQKLESWCTHINRLPSHNLLELPSGAKPHHYNIDQECIKQCRQKYQNEHCN